MSEILLLKRLNNGISVVIFTSKDINLMEYEKFSINRAGQICYRDTRTYTVREEWEAFINYHIASGYARSL